MSITLTLQKFTPSKITYKLYIEDSYICLLNQFPSLEYVEHMIYDNRTEYEWNKWMKLAYTDALLALTYNQKSGGYDLILCPINDVIKYNVLKSMVEYGNNNVFKIEAFENKKSYDADVTCYNFLLNYVKKYSIGHKIKIQFI